MWNMEDWPRTIPFGNVTMQPDPIIEGGKIMWVMFSAGSPRHRSMRGGTYFTIERENSDGTWEIVRTDADADTM